MIEFLTELLITTACAAIGFVAGMLYMRENYLNVIQLLKTEILQLKDGMFK